MIPPGSMASPGKKIWKVIGWVLLGFFSLIMLVILLFYLNRGWIMDRALIRLNESQPGEVRMGKINLIPFMNFPRSAIQLKNVSYYETPFSEDSLYREPIISLDDIFVSLHLLDLIRGDVKVTRARLGNGSIRIELYEDSVTNLEYALGIRFGAEEKSNETPGMPSYRIDLDRLQISNIQLVLLDRIRDHHLNLMIHSLENRFSYLPERVETDVQLDVEINSVKYLSINTKEKRRFQLESDVFFDVLQKRITINPSALTLTDLMLEVWGSCDIADETYLDMGFRATNTGLDVLNFLLRGILDMDEIEQIGSGSIRLDGQVTGTLGNELPLIRCNGTADQIGFRIKSIQKDITGISFSAFASNGTKPDLSEGILQVEGFRASFPEGYITGRLSAKNMITPEVDLEANGDVDLGGLERMLKSDAVADLKGHVNLNGKLKGVVDMTKSDFLDDPGRLNATLTGIGFVMGQDTVERIDGEIIVRENIMEARNMEMSFNKNRIRMDAHVEDLIHYFLGFDRDVKARVKVDSDRLETARLFRDTSLVNMLGEEIEGLHFSAGAQIRKRDLDTFLKNNAIPEIMVSLDSFGVRLPVYADISNMSASLKLGPDTLDLQSLKGMIGESDLGFSGKVINYGALGREDSTAMVAMEYSLASDLIRAEDLLTIREEFLLPETYRTEHLEDFRLKGSLVVPVAGLVKENTPFDFSLDISDLGWNFRYYPLAFDQFLMKIRRKGDQVFVDDFRGKVGESNLRMRARLQNITDTLENLMGDIELESGLLDFNELLNYRLPEDLKDSTGVDSTEIDEPPRLDQIDYPQVSFQVDIDELRYGTYRIFGMKGNFRSSRNKIFYLDNLVTSGESGGQIQFNGQFNVSNPSYYTFSTALDLEEVNVNDLDFEMKSGEESYTLKENFNGLVTAKGLAEIFINPDMTIDMSSSTAAFDVTVTDGALINFTPLQAAAKYLDNKDLNYVRFASLRNRFTLVDSRIVIPLMSVGSSIGQLLIEGEQGLDNSYLYLLRIPTWLVKDVAKSVLTSREEEKEERIYEMQMGKFLVLTVWSDGEASDVRTGDRRDKFQR